VVFPKPDAQIQNLRGTTDRGTSQEHAVGTACARPQKSLGNAAKAFAAFPGLYWRGWPVLQARDCLPSPFPPDAYKSPLVSSECDIQS